MDFIKGRSFCDVCKVKLLWYDNIPLLSYILYGGKSRCCNQKISIRYPLIELATAIGFSFLFYFSFSPIYYILYTITLIILVIDLEHQFIPDELVWLTMLYALCYMPYAPYGLELTPYSYLFSGFVFSLFLLALYFVTKGRGMGLGDVKLVIPLGMLVGLNKLIYFVSLSFIIGGIVSAIMLILKRAKLKTKIAFGPFIIIAFWLITLFR